MKHLLFLSLLIAGTLQAQPIPCPAEPCTLYNPWGSCCTGQLRTYVGNQCIQGPGVIDSTFFYNYRFLSFFNIRVKSRVDLATVDLAGGNKTVYLRDAPMDTVRVNGNDTIIALGGIPRIANLEYAGDGANVIILPYYMPGAYINGVLYPIGSVHHSTVWPLGTTKIEQCVSQILALPEKKKPVFSPILTYNFTVTPFYGGPQMKYKNYTFRRLTSELDAGLVLIEAGGLRQVWLTVE